jgi:phosphate transport system substrate-binding protein
MRQGFPQKLIASGLVMLMLCVAMAPLAQAQTPAQTRDLPRRDLSDLPPYKVEYKVAGGFRIFGSELKGAMEALAVGFKKFHPDVMISTNFMTSSEGTIAGLYTGISDLAPAGDDAKITDMMPFYNTFRYLPTEISIATGGHEKRGTLWPAVIVVNKDNPLTKLTMDQLDRIFGSERTGGWQLGATDLASAQAGDNLLYTSKYARGPETNIRTWGQLGFTGDWANKEIQTYGYIAPGFTIYFERKLLHWSDKWNPNYKEYVEAKEVTNDPAGQAVASERMLEALSKDKYGIGWAAQLHTKDYPNVRQLAIAAKEGGPYVAMTPATVANRTYPLVRDAYIYVNRAPGRPMDPKTREFLRFVLSREGQQIIANTDMYYPLTPDALREQLKRLD